MSMHGTKCMVGLPYMVGLVPGVITSFCTLTTTPDDCRRIYPPIETLTVRLTVMLQAEYIRLWLTVRRPLIARQRVVPDKRVRKTFARSGWRHGYTGGMPANETQLPVESSLVAHGWPPHTLVMSDNFQQHSWPRFMQVLANLAHIPSFSSIHRHCHTLHPTSFFVQSFVCS